MLYKKGEMNGPVTNKEVDVTKFPKLSALQPRHRSFVLHYVRTFNATKSAEQAGFSPRTSGEQGARLLTNVQILEAIREVNDNIMDVLGLTDEWILSELSCIAGVDVSKAFDADGQVLPWEQIPADVKKAMASIEVETNVLGRTKVKRIKFWNKDAALQALLERRSGPRSHKLELSGPGGGPIPTRTLLDLSKVTTEALEKLARGLK